MSQDIKPIETVYNGYRFRSRLEARWAVFFDALGVEYEYEPEGFVLPSGKRYLPDFRVKCYGKRGDRNQQPFDLWVEVKGRMTSEDADRIREFSGLHTETKTTDSGEEYEVLAVRNPIIILHKILPERDQYGDLGIWSSSATGSYDAMDGIEDMYPFNYFLIDGDYFAAYPAAHKGQFYLAGDDSN